MIDDKKDDNQIDELEGFETKPAPRTMADRFEDELKAQVIEEQPVQENTEVVQKARQFGHLTREEWIAQGRDPNQWKTPEQFVQYGEQYKEFRDLVSELKKQNEQQSKKIDLLVEDRKRLAEQSVMEAKQQLEIQLRAAKERGDIDSIEQLAQRKYQLEQQNQLAIQQQQVDEVRQIDELFMSRNGHWFNDTRPDLKMEAQTIANDLAYRNPNITYAQKCIQTEERMRLLHPELFVNTVAISRPQVSMTQSAMNKHVAESGSSSEERLYKSLTPEERAEFNVTKKMVEKIPGIKYTVEEYVQHCNTLKKREA